MISQADFFKTLVSKNSSDESILTAASTPNCKPTKILEKLTEAERFGPALEVSMKYGLDPSSIWKTWAIRCLKNRNFQAAREKFRHCFTRSRPHSGRTSGATSALLAEILNQLSRMPEYKIPLREEVELIKKRKLSEKKSEQSNDKRIAAAGIEGKPTIYEECLYYLREYGTATDYVRFFVKHSLWHNVVQTLIDKKSHINKDKFFINDVFSYSMTVGQLDILLDSFQKIDPEFKRSSEYFRVIYKFLSSNQRPNVLYCIQSIIKDHVAAANTQLIHVFLSKPYRNYRDLYARISSLATACEELKAYLKKCETNPNSSPLNPMEDWFFEEILPDEARELVAKIELQNVITKNFFINEVSGCVNNINLAMIDSEVTWATSNEISDMHLVLKEQIEKLKGESNEYTKTRFKSGDTSPITLFDKDQNRITFLAALVLVYFDPTCSTYFSKTGLVLANQLIRVSTFQHLH